MVSNLLSAKEGLELAPELCLIVIEYLEYSSGLMTTLRTLSKSFYALLQANQKTLCKKFARELVAYSCTRSDVRISTGSCATCIHCTARAKFLRDGFEKQRYSVLERSILPSRASASASQGPRSILHPNTFAWLSELHLRNEQTKVLVQGQGQDTTESARAYASLYSSTASGYFANPIALLRLNRVKAVAIDILFELGDRTAGLSEAQAIRRAQEDFLHELSATQLALLGITLQLLSEGYKKVPKTGRECITERRAAAEMPVEEEARGQREERIVFSDGILRRGPFLAYAHHIAYNSTPGSRQQSVREWFWSEMQDGLGDLRAFEEGSGEGVTGLQSCLAREFCEKTGCSLDERWREMLESLEAMLRLDL